MSISRINAHQMSLKMAAKYFVVVV